MLNPKLKKLLNEEMTRKEFLRLGAITVASLVGVVGIITELLSHAATPYSSDEAESGTRTGSATLTADVTASGGEAVKFGTSTTNSGGPVNSVVPTISGTKTVGSTLTATNGTWSNTPTMYTYKWTRSAGTSATVISGATASTYVLVAADENDTITVTVTAANAAGSASATSAPTTAITASTGTSTANTPARVSFGMYMPEGDYTASNISSVESTLGRKIDVFLDYQNWDRGTAAIPTVPTSVMSGIGTADYQWTIQPSSGPNGASTANCVQWPALIAGDYDSEIQAFGSWIQNTWKRDFYVRFAHEMNGQGWYDWQVGGSCNASTGAIYAEGFNRFASVLKASTSYAKLVWAVNIGYDNVSQFYPSGCDIMAMDGYNNTSNNTWMTDTQVFSSTYNQLAACNATKPIWIAEMACMEPDASWSYNGTTYPAQPQYSKATWVSTFLNSKAYPRVTATTWFNVEKERNWLFNSSSGSTAAFNSAFASAGTKNGVPLS